MRKVSDWLVKNDQKLFAAGTRIKTAKLMCERATGEELSARKFKALRDTHCRYYRKLPMRAFSKQIALAEKQWSVIRSWVMQNKDKLLECESVEVVAKLMRSHGVLSSPTLLSGSCAFRDVWVRELGRKCD